MKVEADALPIDIAVKYQATEPSPRGTANANVNANAKDKDKIDSNTIPLYSGEKYN